ncbi:hypothetical protein BDBG_16792 [Blastomyces gilchristii SLH14081]|uniref:Uncharacterized protein n=1 Tax=Blastomyces gilchristii (strain SLH14081) TaxID=559298 RepID=A0A179UHI5_BLAGS|nr:uncharacterized protein BDBG_16792 [Blastomyces gilchristii SLH14081]OAT07213.1 hypothetical protein BDBG_16792 [Blastomyces gilchristii SLH14081]
MRSYTTVLAGGGGGVATVMRGTEDRLDTDELISRRNDTSLQDTVTTTTAAKEAGEEEGVTMRAVLPRLIDTAAFTFNLAFLVVTEAAAAP